MTAATKTKPAPDPAPFVQVEATSSRFVPPDLDLLPPELHDAQKAVIVTREAWLVALSTKRSADRVAADSKAEHRNALNEAALAGRTLTDVPDHRPTKLHAQEQATEHARVALDAAEQRWRELADAIARHRDQILDDMRPSVDQARADLDALEAKAATQRTITERLTSQYTWLATLGRSTTGRTTTENGSPFLP